MTTKNYKENVWGYGQVTFWNEEWTNCNFENNVLRI